MNNQKSLVFFGSGYYAIPIVEVLKDQGLKLVVTNEPGGELIEYLKKENIPYLFTKFKNPEDLKTVQNVKPNLGILASYGAIIPQKVIDLFPLGILNIHPSLLPQYKGPSPVQYAVLNGDTVCGISIILLDAQIDHGPLVKQETLALKNPKITYKQLTELVFIEGAEMISKIIQNVNNGLSIKSTPQRSENESWTKKIEKKDGEITLENPPTPDELDRKIRAFYPWPGVYLTTSIGGKMRLLKLMPNDTVQVEGKNQMSYKDFINGYKEGSAILKQLGLI